MGLWPTTTTQGCRARRSGVSAAASSACKSKQVMQGQPVVQSSVQLDTAPSIKEIAIPYAIHLIACALYGEGVCVIW